MRRSLGKLLLGATAAALVLSGCGAAARPPAASVNGTEISEAAFRAQLAAVAGNAAYLDILDQAQEGGTVLGSGPGTLSTSFVGSLLTFDIVVELVDQELRRRGDAVTDADRNGARDQVYEEVGGEAIFGKFPVHYQATLLRRRATLAKFQGAVRAEDLDDAAVERFYAANPDQFSSVCSSHILFAVENGGQIDSAAIEAQSDQLEAAAGGVNAELDAGGDFSALAQQHSKDAGSRDRGGSLGCGPAGRFARVPALEQAAASLGVNEVSEPLKTEFGWHLMKVESRELTALAEVTEDIRQRLQAGDQEALSAFLQEAIKKADISVNPRYGTFSTEGESVGVVPPEAPTTSGPEREPEA